MFKGIFKMQFLVTVGVLYINSVPSERKKRFLPLLTWLWPWQMTLTTADGFSAAQYTAACHPYFCWSCLGRALNTIVYREPATFLQSRGKHVVCDQFWFFYKFLLLCSLLIGEHSKPLAIFNNIQNMLA